MKGNLLRLSLFVTAFSILFLARTFTMAADQEQVLKVGQKGGITLSTETKAGDLTLKPGSYMVQHRVEGSDHFVHFTERTKEYPYYRSGLPKAHPGEVKCRLEPLKAKASQTTVHLMKEDGVMRVTKIIIRGENVAHLF